MAQRGVAALRIIGIGSFRQISSRNRFHEAAAYVRRSGALTGGAAETGDGVDSGHRIPGALQESVVLGGWNRFRYAFLDGRPNMLDEPAEGLQGGVGHNVMRGSVEGILKADAGRIVGCVSLFGVKIAEDRERRVLARAVHGVQVSVGIGTACWGATPGCGKVSAWSINEP